MGDMMSKNTNKIILCTLITVVMMSNQVHANSSWHWVTTSPMTLLPLAVILTLTIEIMGIKIVIRQLDLKKIIKVVVIANLLSFLLPYVERAYRFSPTTGGFSFFTASNKGPYFMIMMGYLIITLLVEMPIVYLYLRKENIVKVRLILTILFTNVFTTLLVASIERIACRGVW